MLPHEAKGCTPARLIRLDRLRPETVHGARPGADARPDLRSPVPDGADALLRSGTLVGRDAQPGLARRTVAPWGPVCRADQVREPGCCST